jgi:hypothetical protein
MLDMEEFRFGARMDSRQSPVIAETRSRPSLSLAPFIDLFVIGDAGNFPVDEAMPGSQQGSGVAWDPCGAGKEGASIVGPLREEICHARV